jgi:hypothetical protein
MSIKQVGLNVLSGFGAFSAIKKGISSTVHILFVKEYEL